MQKNPGVASTSRRRLVNNHPLSRKRSNLPSTQGVVWIILAVVVTVSLSLFCGVLYVVNETPAGGSSGQKVLEPRYSVNAAQDRSQLKNKAQPVLAQLRSDFAERYGSYASQIRERGIQRFTTTTTTTAAAADRPPVTTAGLILRAAANHRPFQMAFAGYSVTVGRGNFFQQSYPFVLQQILQPAFRAIFQTELHVRNAAIGGIPSFPYGFCLEHFLGPTPDVISWDFSMNEMGADNTAVLEAYIRHSQQQLSESGPMLISLDTHSGRCDILNQYAQQRLLPGALCVGKADAVFGKSELASFDKESSSSSSSTLPVGLQEWSEFGAPRNCPGRSGWHPKKKEHELIAWMIAMEFVDALEEAVQIADNDPNWMKTYKGHSELDTSINLALTFPKPLSKTLPINQSPAIDRLLFGHEMVDNAGQYQIHHVSCRTSFLPATDHTKVLPNIVVSGLADRPTADNIMTLRTDEDYSNGWVMDVSSVERETKVKVEKCGGLGYEDMKIALYGVPESGPLRLWLPIHSLHVLTHSDHHGKHNHNEQDLLATHWLDSLVLCEANEKRSAEACKLDRDLQLTVGGEIVPPTSVVLMHGAGEYLKRPTCVHVTIPESAKMTPIDDVQVKEDAPLDDVTRQRLQQGLDTTNREQNSHKQKKNNAPRPLIGLVVDVRADPRVTRSGGACCLSHVAWEMH